VGYTASSSYAVSVLKLMTFHARRYAMTLRPQSLPPVPEATVAAVQAAFPKGNPYGEYCLSSLFGAYFPIV
jgi:hypothetical protein